MTQGWTVDELRDLPLGEFIDELLNVAADEEAGITDIPVDDLLRVAAEKLRAQAEAAHAAMNDRNMFHGLAEERSFIIERMETQVREVEDMNDKLSTDMDYLLRAAWHQGFTEWVDSEGIVRPIPMPWPANGFHDTDENGRVVLPPSKAFVDEETEKLRSLYKAYPPTFWAPKPPKGFTNIIAT